MEWLIFNSIKNTIDYILTIYYFSELPSFLTILNGYSVLAFQFDIHPMLLTLQIDMQKKSQVYWAAFSGIMGKFIKLL